MTALVETTLLAGKSLATYSSHESQMEEEDVGTHHIK